MAADAPRRAAVLGSPIAHSLSPLLHTAAYGALCLDWRYDAIECDAAGLVEVLAARADWAGFSATMPLKRAVVDVADEVRPAAAAVGAGNTLLPRQGGGWVADNTDVAGIVDTVREGGVAPRTATLIGAGGTAQAAVVALGEFGVTSVDVLVRDVARTAQLQATADRAGVRLAVHPMDADAAALGADLVLSTLPAGAADPLAGFGWRAHQAVFDVVYDPWPTALAAAARQAGATVLSGGLLLLHQAARQVELMTGHDAPLAAMRAALRVARPHAGV